MLSAVDLKLSPPLIVAIDGFKSLILLVFYVGVGEKLFKSQLSFLLLFLQLYEAQEIHLPFSFSIYIHVHRS
jgi:hypothetical protein